MIKISRFSKETATLAHENTILASPVFEPEDCPIGTAYGYLEKDGAKMDRHSHHTLEYYIVHEGEGYVEVDGEESYVKAGDVIKIPRDKPHSMRCKGDKPFLWSAYWWE